ncbi:MAG: sugar transferase [Bacteroidales bacterium]|nr:sugar transferase [Bacteroidales bacterium]
MIWWIKGNEVDISMLVPQHGKMLAKNDYLVEIKKSQEYNDKVVFPGKVRINRYYLHNYSFWTDIKIIFATVLGRRMKYGEEEI